MHKYLMIDQYEANFTFGLILAMYDKDAIRRKTRPRVYSCAQSQRAKLTLLTPEGHVKIKTIITIFEIVFRKATYQISYS